MGSRKDILSFGMKDGRISIDEIGRFHHVETADYIGLVLGKFMNPISFDEINSIDGMYQLYKDVENFLKTVDGMYLVCMYLKHQKKLIVIPDVTSSPYSLYYTLNEEKFYLSTYMRTILHESKIPREVNNIVVPSIFKNFCVMNSKTLVKRVHKIQPGTYLEVSELGVLVRTHPGVYLNLRSFMDISVEEMLQRFIEKQFDNEIHMALSAGFDSNLLLSCAAKSFVKDLHTYTVGEKYGKSESETVRRIVSSYNVKSHYFDISAVGNDLPDIIWRLEGSVFENGIVLQYYLAKLAVENGCRKILCGESADEVMFKNYNQLRNPFSMETYSENRIPFSENPFLATNLVVLKKNGIMMNSFGIHPVYAYKTARFIDFSERISLLNNNSKAEFKRICFNIFTSDIKGLVSSSGGATDPRSFINPDDMMILLETIENTWVGDSLPWIRQNKAYLKKLFHSNTSEGFEMASDVLTGIGMILFEKLFISGDFDYMNNEDGCKVSLNDII